MLLTDLLAPIRSRWLLAASLLATLLGLAAAIVARYTNWSGGDEPKTALILLLGLEAEAVAVGLSATLLMRRHLLAVILIVAQGAVAFRLAFLFRMIG